MRKSKMNRGPDKKFRVMKNAKGLKTEDKVRRPPRRTKQNVALAMKINKRLHLLFPELSPETISASAIDLADIWKIGKSHDYYLQQFFKTSVTKNPDKFESLLITWIEVELLYHCQWHLRSLKRNLPKLLRAATKSRPEKQKTQGPSTRRKTAPRSG